MLHNLVIFLNGYAEKASKRAELFAVAAILAIVLMLVLPMPIWLLDILIAINLCAAGLMVAVSMYMPGPTAFSTFPAVLLLTTLFRLALEVSTTRKILLDANAGHIVETFGNFVVGGNLVVGLVVFLILTVVQFIVITKGSERVSEVSARFTLDAMPGKQMSIDSDLRSNILTAEQAKHKRAELAKESQLHGAMDGAMKFVKGDSIAGIFIVAVNLIGGISIGVLQKNMSAASAMQLYSVLTIGDALIAQIPSLLISLTAGLITTRVSDENRETENGEKANVGQEMVAQLFGQPKALVTASVIMLMFGLIPGMPMLVFFVLSILLAVAGAVGLLWPAVELEIKRRKDQSDAQNASIVDLTTFSVAKSFLVRMPKNLHNTVQATSIMNSVRIMRNTILERRGIPDLPTMDFEFADSVPVGRVHFLMSEVPLVDVEIRGGWAAAIESVERLTELGFSAIEDSLAGTRRKRVWVRADNQEALQKAGVVSEPWESVFAADIEVEMMRNCQMFIGVHEVQRFTKWAERRFPELGKELGRSVTLPRLAEVLQRLAREGVSMRNARLILETILEWSPKERDPDVIADYVRLALKRQLCHEVTRDGLIEVLIISPELEDTLRESIRQTSRGSYLDLNMEVEQLILDNLGRLVGSGGTPAAPPVLVTAADLRRSVRRLIEEEFFSVNVLSFAELTQHARVQPLGMLELNEA